MPVRTITRFRRPEYTGKNRCYPCTIVNLGIALIASLAVAGVLAWSTTAGEGVSGVVGAGVFLASAATIYLRGYIVPGTPALTRRYLPDRVLRWFDKDVGDEVTGADEIDVETVLVDAAVLEECDDGADLCLTPAFSRDLERRIETVRDGDDDPQLTLFLNESERASVDRDDLGLERFADAVTVRLDGRRVAQWPSEAASIADRAAAAELGRRVPEWDELGFVARTELAGAIRLWLPSCPGCGSPVAPSRDTVESCCREIDVVAIACDDCGSRLLEVEYEPDAAAAAP